MLCFVVVVHLLLTTVMRMRRAGDEDGVSQEGRIGIEDLVEEHGVREE